jgi:hypothetical protein
MQNVNCAFLDKVKESFRLYLDTGARSNEKLKPIHSFIADALKQELNDPELTFCSLRPGQRGGEKSVAGRYMDKNVDIAVCRGDTVLGAVGFKFVMSNYKQNSNNYFENMLGETANIRCNRIPYFQVLVLLKELPYYDNSGRITRTEHINEHNLHKYIKLSEDNIETFFHTPTKTLIYVVSLSESLSDHHIANKAQYNELFRDKDLNVDNEFNDLFQSGVVINDFAKFIKKVASYINSI